MPYGTASKETLSFLTEDELAAIDGEGNWRVDVIVSGALDESFNVLSDNQAYNIAEAIARSLEFHKDLEPGEDYEVSIYFDVPEPPKKVKTFEGVRRGVVKQTVFSVTERSPFPG